MAEQLLFEQNIAVIKCIEEPRQIAVKELSKIPGRAIKVPA